MSRKKFYFWIAIYNMSSRQNLILEKKIHSEGERGGIMSSRKSELGKIAKQFHCRTRVNFKRWCGVSLKGIWK